MCARWITIVGAPSRPPSAAMSGLPSWLISQRLAEADHWNRNEAAG